MSQTSPSTTNASTIEAWNTVLFEKFSRYEHILIEGLGQHGEVLFARFPPPRGAGVRVLDIGCGLGDSTVRLGSLVDGGEVVGVDCAQNFVDASSRRAAAAGADRVRFLRRDVQVDDLGGPYDAAYARFGTMFFDSPVAALRNVRRSLAPGGKLMMSVWRKREDNPCFYIPQQVVERFIDESDKAKDEVTCGPGPFSMASADLLSDQLLAAGFEEPRFLRFDAPLCMGRTVDEAIAFASDIGPAGESLRLARTKAAHLRNEITEALCEALRPLEREDGFWATSSTWLVAASVPVAR
ncbi:MAG: methyltransferase domain-containing protein [Polyangiaceae bacterium]